MKKSTCSKLLRVFLLCFAMMFVFAGVFSFAEDYTPVSDSNVVDEIFAVFDKVGAWIVDALSTFVVVFYSPTTGLTFLGVLALISLAIAVIFLVIGVIQGFLKFRS